MKGPLGYDPNRPTDRPRERHRKNSPSTDEIPYYLVLWIAFVVTTFFVVIVITTNI